MDDLIAPLFLCGGAGWLLLICSLSLGGRKHSVLTALQTFVLWAMGVDFLGTWSNPVEAVVRKAGLGWRFVTFFVVLPYALWAGWLCRRWKRRRMEAAANPPPAARRAP